MSTLATVLIIEDEAATALALSDVLKSEGYEVLMEGDGESGLKTALEKKPDLILADLKMPKMNGLEMIAAIRQDAWGKDAEIIILTNASDVESLDTAMASGTFNYFVKGDTAIVDVVKKVHDRLFARGVLKA